MPTLTTLLSNETHVASKLIDGIQRITQLEGKSPSHLSTTVVELEKIRDDHAADSNEDAANSAWLAINLAKALQLVEEAQTRCQSEDPLALWHHVVEAEERFRSVARFENEPARYGIPYAIGRVLDVQYMFPYRLFMSIEVVASRHECTLCGADPYGTECTHIPGNLYMGRRAGTIVHEVKEMPGAALTDRPKDKRCVVQTVGGEAITANRKQFTQLLDNGVSWLHHISFDETPRRRPRADYDDVSLGAKCPCRSGKRFGTCCSRRKQILVPWRHINIHAETDPMDAFRGLKEIS